MNSLFWKIFAWFWAAMALFVLLLAGVEALSPQEPRPSPRRALLGDGLRLYGNHAARVYARGGTAALRRELQTTNARTEIDGFLFDDAGRELAGQKPPAELRELAARARDSRHERWRGDVGGLMWAQTVAPHRTFAAQVERVARGGMRPHARQRLLNTLALIAIAGLVCGALAWYLSAPVARLRAATQRLAQGDLTARSGVGARRRDELALLARDFDGMAERLASLITAQRRLLGDISHELRSPLARLNVALELARRDTGSSRHLQRIERESARLDALIEDLLTLARLDSNAAFQTGEAGDVDLRALAQDVTEDADFEARAAERRVLFQADDGAWQTRGDEELLRRALENVVRNAVRHTPPDTRVEVRLRREGGSVLLSVRDAGPGVPEESLQTIFEPFYRVEDARERDGNSASAGGSGLGLAIARRAVERHGGGLRAFNAPGGGLEVELRLPLGA